MAWLYIHSFQIQSGIKKEFWNPGLLVLEVAVLYVAAASGVKVASWVRVAFRLKSSGSKYWLSKIVPDNFFLRLNQKSGGPRA